MKKVIVYYLLAAALSCLLSLLYQYFFIGKVTTPQLFKHQITVRDVVTGAPVPGVTLAFTFADYCHSEDVLRDDYDYSTCEGRYEPIHTITTDKTGIAIPDISSTNHPPARAVRYYVQEAPNYHPTRSYGLTHHDTVWLVPLDAPLESKESAIQWLDSQDSMQKVFDFYTKNNIGWEYLYAEKEAWYGIWRVTLNLSGELIRNQALTVLVHPKASEYVICNPEYQITTGTTEERFAKMNRERDFLSSLPESLEYEFGTEGCSSELLLE